MNKKHYLSLVLILSIIVCMMPFSTVKAMTQIRPEVNKTITYGGITYGWYNHYAYLTSNSGEVINTSQFGVGPVGYYKTVDVITIGFNDPLTGEIEINFTNSLTNYTLVYIDGDNTGSYRWSGSNKVLYVSFNNCQSFDVYMYSTSQYTQSNLPTIISSISFTSVALSAGAYSSYQIPTESLTAYAFPCETMPPLQYYHGELYPTLHIDYALSTSERSKRIQLNASNRIGGELYWVFISKEVIMNSYYNLVLDNGVNGYRTKLMGLEGSTSSSEMFFVYRFTFYTENGQSGGNAYIEWNHDLDIIPIYLGTKSHCPSSLRGLCGFTEPLDTIESSIVGIEQTLLDILGAIYNIAGDSGQTSENIDDVNDELNDITSDIDAIEADIDDLFDSHIINIDLDDYDIFDDMVNTNLFFKTYLDDVFTNLGDFKAVIIVPVIVTVMMIMLGWVL